MEEWKVDGEEVVVLQERVGEAGRVATGMMKEEGYRVKREQEDGLEGYAGGRGGGRGRGGGGRGGGRGRGSSRGKLGKK
jgi:hypothetical protein